MALQGGGTALTVRRQASTARCSVLLEKTDLLMGPSAQNDMKETPLDLVSSAFRDELMELNNAVRLDASPGAVGRRTALGQHLVHGRYHVYQSIGAKVQLAEDVRTHTAVALKTCGSAEEAQHESDMLRMIGPDYVPELYDYFVDGASGNSVLAMEIADSHAELSRFCTRCGDRKLSELRRATTRSGCCRSWRRCTSAACTATSSRSTS